MLSRAANVFFAVLSVCGLILLIRSISDYELYSGGPTWIAIYFVAPAALALLPASAVFLRPALKLQCLSLAIAALAGVYAAEVYVAWSPVFTGNPPDQRSRALAVRDFRDEGVRAYPIIGAASLSTYSARTGNSKADSPVKVGDREILPFGGVSKVFTVDCNEIGDGWVTYASDEHGFRNPLGLWDGGAPDVIAIGDSFTFGQCTDMGDDFPGVVRERFPKTINLAAAGNGPLQELATFREYVTTLRPKVVLWGFTEKNDLVRLARDLAKQGILQRYYSDPAYRQVLPDGSPLIEAQVQIDDALRAFVEKALPTEIEMAVNEGDWGRRPIDTLLLRSLRAALGLARFRLIISDETATERDVAVFRNIIENVKKETESWGGRLFVVYIPTWERYWPVLLGQSTGDYGFVYRAITDMLRDLNVPNIDGKDFFDRHSNPKSLMPGPSKHFNARGYRVIGEGVTKALLSEGLNLKQR